MRRAATALAIALLLPACGGDEETPSSERKGSADSGTTAKIGATCQPTTALPEADRETIHATAQAAFTRLRGGELDMLWSALHPQARREDQREAFTTALTSMQHRLESGSETAEVTDAYVVDIRGGASALARVQCGAQGDPGGLTLITNAGDEDVAMVNLVSSGDPFGFATTVQLRRHADAWRVLGVHVGLSAYRGRGADDYERLADAYVKQQRVLEAYLVLTVANQLANRGGSVKLDRALAIADKLDAVGNSKEFQQQLGVWEVGGRRYDVQGFSVTSTQSDLSAVIRYVTPTGLIQEALDQEADALLAHLGMQHPEIAKRFDAVVFEAYESEAAAGDPGGEIQAYRTARVFPEPVAEDEPGKTSRPG
ncbi:MAG: hypothetical protein KUG77_12095 [Nannocystaceae bacterium]|nr:hypothetical protein [Nannocystaceae bacterium]